MPWLTIRGHHLHYEAVGAGRPLLLLHSGLGSTQEWQPQLNFFSNHYRVIAVDRWGYGRSEGRPAFEDDFFQRDADDQVAILDTLGLERADVIGHSDGGTVALWMAIRHPHRVQRLVLEAAHVFAEAETLDTLRAHGGPADWSPAFRRYLERQHPSHAVALATAWLTRWTSTAMECWDMRPSLAEIAVPALIIQGTADTLSTLRQVQALADGLQHSETWLVAGAGHAPHLEQPGEFNARVLAWLQLPP